MTDNRIKKVVIFAGGKGTRLAEQTNLIPKPLVPIGPDPVLIHIMRHFYRAGYREFIIAVGYMSDEFKRYFRDYSLSKRDVIFTKYGMQVSDSEDVEDWVVNIVETGENSTTGQRLNSVRRFLKPGETFFLTYGDSVSDVPLKKVEALHFSQPDNTVTITAINRTERFGILRVNGDNKVANFSEKSSASAEYINGGFIACDYSIFDEVSSEAGDLSFEVLTKLASEGKMSYYPHSGFWHAMDTQKDVDDLNKLYDTHPEYFNS
jgi:glucose-1-phosphate cytidylyltransferase